ncbi:MAG: hypothetical protein QY331_07805 [Melioribacteraceae bacterium]|nr:hypothetical protein [Melioribacteraceae bacterium]RJP61640.1 MAG: hypothetical protein C4543_03060 [Ignavibacteriales bacterium]WKZ71150.1 MAG: hypothetical protein QY331_07805 [Melioribacteraceae bacterium]
MPESTKYDFFMDELSSLEKQIYKFLQKNSDTTEENKALQKRIKQLEKENEVLKLKVDDIEVKLNNAFIDTENSQFSGLFNDEEKIQLKNKINDLITKIDFHLRS